jgi:hypothetical protein|tara:strand:+ start:254 stop:364 length:111 start_codon:yes stop_codon:yes gene_type:complete
MPRIDALATATNFRNPPLATNAADITKVKTGFNAVI